MTRLIITPYDGKNPGLLTRCIESVAPTGIEHLILETGNNWESVMYEHRNDADMVAQVDADDEVVAEAVVAAFDLLESSNVGLVYTDEEIIDMNGNVLKTLAFDRTINDLMISPAGIHHLTVIKKDMISEVSIRAFRKTRCLYNWISIGEVCIKHGFARLPQVGYKWRNHPDQITKQQQKLFADNRNKIRAEFHQWIRENPQ